MIYILFMLLQTALLFYSTVTMKEKAYRGAIKDNISGEGRRKKSFCLYSCILSALFLFSIAALRGTSVGYDSGQYARHFLEIRKLPWREVIEKYNEEPGFYLLCKIISIFTNDPQWLFIVTGGIYAGALCYFVYRESSNPAISFLMLFPMQFFSFLLTGMRQALAFSIVLLFYIVAAKKKHKKRIFFIGILIAMLFHRSAILAIGYLLLPNKKILDKQRIIFVVLLPIVYIFGRQIIEFFQIFLYSDYELYEEAKTSFATIAVYLGVWFVYVIFVQKHSITQEGDNKIERFLMIGSLLQMLVSYQPNLFRIAMYYQIMTLVAIPRIIDRQEYVNKNIMTWVFCILMYIMFIVFTYYSGGINPYEFFWQ